MPMLTRFWNWYFWGTAPTWGVQGATRFHCWLWRMTHPGWVREWRWALWGLRAQQACRARPQVCRHCGGTGVRVVADAPTG